MMYEIRPTGSLSTRAGEAIVHVHRENRRMLNLAQIRGDSSLVNRTRWSYGSRGSLVLPRDLNCFTLPAPSACDDRRRAHSVGDYYFSFSPEVTRRDSRHVSYLIMEPLVDGSEQSIPQLLLLFAQLEDLLLAMKTYATSMLVYSSGSNSPPFSWNAPHPP